MAVVDGDTFTMIVDDQTVIVRLADVGAPEAGECGASAAAEKLAELLGNSEATYEKVSESYGRWVCEIWNANGVHVNEAMREFLGGYRRR